MGTEIINQIFELCVLPLLGILVRYFIKWLESHTKKAEEEIDTEITKKYIELLTDTVKKCVISTNQTYVDTLKKLEKFDAEAQKIAFEKTKTDVLAILSEEAQIYLVNLYGDLNLYITTLIENAVNESKSSPENIYIQN